MTSPGAHRMMTAMGKTAAALIIGNELLSGKIQERNLAFLAKELFALGIQLRRVVMCLDDVETIATELNDLRAKHDIVFTSGGVGPTHDDMTLPAVAHAFGRRLVRAEELASLIRDYHGDRTTDAHLRMADVPEGAELISSEQVRWPTVAVENVFIFPGVPEIFRMKFAVLRERLSGGERFYTRATYTLCDEGEIAALLARLEESYGDVLIGSYPTFRDADYRTKITFDGRDPEILERAQAEFVAGIPERAFVRSE